MKTLCFAKRNLKEIYRDLLTVVFGLGFPIIILLLLSTIQKNIPVSMFEPEKLTPGITVFGLSFITLFSATLISKDRESSFLHRLYTTPLTATGFIIGYTLPLLPLSLLQGAVTYIAALLLGLKFTLNILLSLLLLVPVSVLYIALGLLFGSILSVKQAGSVCGALLTNLSAWISGIWFDISLMGSTFEKIANILPFIHAVELERAALSGDIHSAIPHLLWVCGYSSITLLLAVSVFLQQMKRQ